MPTPATQARPRTAGVLLHPTSLPGPFGVGDLGPAARAWVDLLARSGQTWWQVLPLNPPGAGDSPYSAFSAFAGNPLLVSPDDLMADGLLRGDELAAAHLPAGPVNYPLAAAAKDRLLGLAWERFRDGAAPELRIEYTKFAASAGWLEDYALFTALKQTLPVGVWTDWPADIVARDPDALSRARAELADPIGRERFAQFVFARQLAALRTYAAARGVQLLGDMPIFISGDSADVWANPHLFDLDADRRPRFVAGVPPDYFSATGQRWGNPQYNWDAMRADGYSWWAARLRAALGQVDAVRLDHFRGFEAFWEIPAQCPTAIEGRWVKGPGAELLTAVRDALGGLPLVAEDLGVITPEVDELREQFALPGMRIIQFAFGGAVEARFLPHAFDRSVVAYTGTHDNDTTRGWYAGLVPAEITALERYTPEAKADPVWALIRLALASVAETAIVPLQDVLDLGTEARMNTPGTVGPWNWSWRVTAAQLDPAAFDRLAALTATYGRSATVG